MSLSRKMSIGIKGISPDPVTQYEYSDPSSIHLQDRGILITIDDDEHVDCRRREFWNWRHVVWFRVGDALWPRVVDDRAGWDFDPEDI